MFLEFLDRIIGLPDVMKNTVATIRRQKKQFEEEQKEKREGKEGKEDSKTEVVIKLIDPGNIIDTVASTTIGPSEVRVGRVMM